MYDEILEKKMHELRQIGEKHAKYRKLKLYLQHYRKILLAKLMKEHMLNSNTGKMETAVAQDREARADPKYKQLIRKLAMAEEKELKYAWEKKLFEMKFDEWKTGMINQTIEAKKYGV
jgi:hypothetical protein